MSTVLCHGVFDALHPGHVAHLNEAKALGDFLIVSVVADRYVNKGPGRPVYNENHRMDMLLALRSVDQVMLSPEPGASSVIASECPDIYVRGPDYADPDHQFSEAFNEERRAVESYGGRVVFTTAPVMSSTDVIRDSLPQHPRLTIQWLQKFGQRYSVDEINERIDRAKDLSVLCVGERIIDEYIDVTAQGRSAKDSIITWTRGKRTQTEGGIVAVALHAGAVTDHASLWRGPNIPTITKTRYVEQPFNHKVFGVYQTGRVDGEPVLPIKDQLTAFDITIVVDYGHGLFDEETARQVSLIDPFPATSRRDHWLALTVQANSANWGMNTLNKWRSADYIVLDEAELRLAFQDRETSIAGLSHRVLDRWNPQVFVVTLGHNGCIVFERGQLPVAIPALGVNIVDRTGAGDTFLAVSAPLIRAGVEPEVAAFVGSVAAAIQVSHVGTGHAVTREELRQWVKALIR